MCVSVCSRAREREREEKRKEEASDRGRVLTLAKAASPFLILA